MDDETRDAQELTRDELLLMAARGESARVARKEPRRIRRKRQDLNQVAARIAAEATRELGPSEALLLYAGEASIEITQARFAQEGPVTLAPSKTVEVAR